MVYCVATGAVAIWACTGYNMIALLPKLIMHTSIYGIPSIVISDQGSQMISDSREDIDWKKVDVGISEMGVQEDVQELQATVHRASSILIQRTLVAKMRQGTTGTTTA